MALEKLNERYDRAQVYPLGTYFFQMREELETISQRLTGYLESATLMQKRIEAVIGQVSLTDVALR